MKDSEVIVASLFITLCACFIMLSDKEITFSNRVTQYGNGEEEKTYFNMYYVYADTSNSIYVSKEEINNHGNLIAIITTESVQKKPYLDIKIVNGILMINSVYIAYTNYGLIRAHIDDPEGMLEYY